MHADHHQAVRVGRARPASARRRAARCGRASGPTARRPRIGVSSRDGRGGPAGVEVVEVVDGGPAGGSPSRSGRLQLGDLVQDRLAAPVGGLVAAHRLELVGRQARPAGARPATPTGCRSRGWRGRRPSMAGRRSGRRPAAPSGGAARRPVRRRRGVVAEHDGVGLERLDVGSTSARRLVAPRAASRAPAARPHLRLALAEVALGRGSSRA